MFQENVLPRHFFGKSKSLSPIVGNISKMRVNKSGLGLLNIVTSTNEKESSSNRSSTELIQSMAAEGSFSNSNNLLALREERCNIRKKWDDVNDTKLKELFPDLDTSDHHLILRAKNTCTWLNV